MAKYFRQFPGNSGGRYIWSDNSSANIIYDNEFFDESSEGSSFTLVCETGSFSLSGQSSNLTASRLLTADVSNFSLSGNNASLLATKLLTASVGTFQFTGVDIQLLSARKIIADVTAFTLSGNTAQILKSSILTADNGSFSLSGNAAELIASRILTANTGTFILTGQSIQFLFNKILSTVTGSFSLQGNDASLIASRLLQAAVSNFVVNAFDAELRVIRVLNAETGIFILSGKSVSLIYTHPTNGVIILEEALCEGATSNTIRLTDAASSIHNNYEGALVFISSGTGMGQTRKIKDYNGSNKTIKVTSPWVIVPDFSSKCVVIPDGNPSVLCREEEFCNGANYNSIALSDSASSDKNAYISCLLVITSGTGLGQSREIKKYNGSNKRAFINIPWVQIPDQTSKYVIIPKYSL